MKLLGVTGGVGMGKSACAQLLRERGLAVVDTDDLARQVVEPGRPALTDIQAIFGAEILNAQGGLRRDALARIVFSDPAMRRKLEAILHPPIRQLWRAQVHDWRQQGLRLGVVVIPLLFETGAQSEFDATVCVACSSATQVQRLRARSWSLEQIEQRIRAQMPVEQKIEKSNFMIWTESSLDVHAEQLDRVLRLQ
jgi:dephospho-CoA kinase